MEASTYTSISDDKVIDGPSNDTHEELHQSDMPLRTKLATQETEDLALAGPANAEAETNGADVKNGESPIKEAATGILDDKDKVHFASVAQADEENTVTVDLAALNKKKKRSSKPKSKRGKNKPTGYEEYYVDAPMTPDEYTEELSIYDVTRPILYRMEDAILRYQKNRRMIPDRSAVFMKYLGYGGVNVSQKMFTGVEDRELQEMDKEQILLMKGQTSIDKDRTSLLIDFNAVVKGYLTSYFPYHFNPESEEMVKLATVTIRNFLSYLLYHDVCPEYKENIDMARTSCDIAGKELWNNQQFTTQGPGDFNKACSTLFGGAFFDMSPEDNQWENEKDASVRMTPEIAQKVTKFALAGAGSDTQAVRFKKLATDDDLRAMQVEDIDGFEVTAVIPPDPGVLEFYRVYAPDLQPVGRMLGKPYRDPAKPELDLSPEERLQWERDGAPDAEFEFYLEEGLLKLCYPGMKVMTSVFELNCGVHFFDDVNTAYSSIYTVLANDLMLGWKKPRSFLAGEKYDDSDGDGKESGSEKKDIEQVV